MEAAIRDDEQRKSRNVNRDHSSHHGEAGPEWRLVPHAMISLIAVP